MEKDTKIRFVDLLVVAFCPSDDFGKVREAERGVHEGWAPRRGGGFWHHRHAGGQGADGTSLFKVCVVICHNPVSHLLD